jgi:hypothetical protein
VKRCPFCAEEVQDHAIKCRFCEASLLPGTPAVVTATVPVKPNPSTSGMAIASLVLGIIWIYWIGSILALVFGYIARRKIDRNPSLLGGRGMAIAGIVLGWVGVGVLILIVVVAIVRAIVGGILNS